MAKARKKKTTDTGPVNASEAIDQVMERVTVQPEGIVHGPSTLAPERVAAHEHGHAAQHAPHRDHGQSHADAVGKRPERVAGYTPGFKDQLAGAHRLEHHNPYLSVIRFDEKPSDAVRQLLGENHFTWSQENKEWKRPIRFETRQQDREDARRVFDEVCQMIRQERGITHSYGGAA